ncbi:hypothetical protein E1B28_007191 [Marasmius oreades]|uniref:Uncharacterized protein n=1 Tax=Marasmius oreades TaxID=181124 RepID=A0A9P7S1S3_9AGAR|nr:uncharacterized protein E1B28_007191 [Marasmius oreades]KAG7093517.1 hypothetical protein E1B28_007191 [Marasmius oreades]
MSAGDFPTLSSALLVYTKLIRQVDSLMQSDTTILNSEVLAGLKACKVKLEKYFDKSTYESEYYYAATGTLSFLTHTIVLNSHG